MTDSNSTLNIDTKPIARKTKMKKLFILILCIAISIPLLMLFTFHVQGYLSQLSNIITQKHLFFTGFRWFLIALFFRCWRPLVYWRARRHGWEKEKIHYWLQQRNRLFVYLIVFELLVCENLLWRFVHWI